MTPDDFISLVKHLAPSVTVKSVLDSVQFRLGGKTFATVGWPEAGWAVVKVNPARQAQVLSASEALAPEPGRRRRAGIILVRLGGVDAGVAGDVLAEALIWAQKSDRRLARGPRAVVENAERAAA